MCFSPTGLWRYVTWIAIYAGRPTSRKTDAEDQSGEKAQVLVSLGNGVSGSDHVPGVCDHGESHAHQGTKDVWLSLTKIARTNSRHICTPDDVYC